MILFVFDMDGTVLDSMSTLREEAIKIMMERFHLSRPEAELGHSVTAGHPFREQLRLLFAPTDLFGDLQRRKDATIEYEARHHVLSCTFPIARGIEDVLMRIKDLKHKSALVTSTYKEILGDTPQVLGLEFDSHSGYAPPKDQQIRALQKRWSPTQTILFGDTRSDGHCAKEVGAEFYQVTCQNVADRVWSVLDGDAYRPANVPQF
jgi:beta-phosphoglucomutase-like phosphatase (HAD superfamily)